MELPQDLHAWQDGYDAGLGVNDQRCPYPADSNEAWSWYTGFLEGRAERFRRTSLLE